MSYDHPFTVIIGLETHVQLLTESKLFCRCSTTFGEPPNTQTCPVCTGSPGALPVMNAEAFRLSVKTAVALNCRIPEFTKWDRKQYYYPDLPKGYQISQFDLPMSEDGWLEIADPLNPDDVRRIGIIRAHLEEDAGKSMHDEAAGKSDTRIDLNRTGTPLLEIVTQPDLRSAAEAKAYLTELKLLLMYLGVSDCNMQEGSLRVDANVNLHIETDGGKIATPIVEVKNLNSFRAVERALTYEVDRQYHEWCDTGRKLGDPGVSKQTSGWDDAAQRTRLQRSKEESSDYRYFPDPDLVPVVVSPEEVEAVRQALGELPAALRSRLESQYELKAYDADVIVNQGRAVVDYYETLAAASGDPRRASNWLQQDVLRTLNEMSLTIEQFPLTAAGLGELLKLVEQGDLDNTKAKDVFAHMLAHGESAAQAMKSLGIEQVDDSALETLCQELLDANPKTIADVQAGKMQAVGALIGQAKKKNPNVNPADVKRICLELIARM
ncbi:Aspartyl/glutamyl-tRNA(Asn/Gln) amidotransferase subunit B [Lignipirellula cremea]|uniref:Aspartyl/glutamyl-tRNA(Asn/Gln) amidotransferase subunit B n=1 Tax=Lignipirellula cremea TaxID=2528010 RepID=A0A518E143_9BACT|nr:Asp-tRNA(Asn)/Glu-tRNA(Gln) amidotransferase subunit GatB [Lignipirellula cremea]QDU97815.1 Aspartyl/glutamyl-tRNA(Asn/Gln) amidotransferase subunit B [Lignipirellula cremea]